MLTIRLIYESLGFAWRALKSNILRTVLSLLGVTIGIFSIIAVLTLVDSLEKNIRDSLNFLGSNVIYVGKWPFIAQGRDTWKQYINRPNISYAEYKFLRANMQDAQTVAIFADRGGITVKGGNNGISEITLKGADLDFDKIFEIDIAYGRYLTNDEIEGGRNVVIIGFEVAKALFPNNQDSPMGLQVKIRNLKFTVVGVTKREGESFLGTPSNDYSVIIPYDAFRKLYQTGTGRWNELGSDIGLKGFDTDIGLVELENEARGLMRVKRGLKPIQNDSFALNRPEAIGNAISGVFDVLSVAGWIIGGFSMLVGGFGIANIMFVSVKERTSVIGLQKFLVWLMTLAPFGSLQVVLSVKNIVLGLGVSSVIGLVAGIVPAAMASRLDPVIAIRAN